MAKAKTDAKEPGEDKQTPDDAATPQDAVAVPAATAPLRSRFIAIRREEVAAPGGSVNINVVLEAVPPKRDSNMKLIASVNDALWETSGKPNGFVTLSGLIKETALMFEIGKEYHLDFSPVPMDE